MRQIIANPFKVKNTNGSGSSKYAVLLYLPMQHNKSFNVDCQINAVFPQVRCAAS